MSDDKKYPSNLALHR